MTDTTAPRTAAPDLARLRRLHQAETQYVYTDTGYRAAEPGPDTRAIVVCSCDLGSGCAVPSLLEAIEPLLALVRAALLLPNHLHGGKQCRCVYHEDFDVALAALPESVRVAARKPE